MRVSVIVPCYNYGHFLPDAFRSLAQQDHTDWECWVIDDGSGDATADVVRAAAAVDSRIHYLFQPNQGQPAARNKGLQHVRGEYIQFLDADDWLEPAKFSRQLAYLKDHPDTDIVYGEVRYFRDEPGGELFLNRWGDPMEEWMPKVSGQGLPVISSLVDKNILELGCALFRKRLVDQVGLFDAGLQGVEDHDFCLRAALRGGRFRYLEVPGTHVLMRHHGSSYSKGLFSMYKKELELRFRLERQLRDPSAAGPYAIGHRSLLCLNRERYEVRMRKLQDLVIDQVRKGQRQHLSLTDLQWFRRHGNTRQNGYFFSRILKALLT